MTTEPRQLQRSDATLNENSFNLALNSTDTKPGDQMKVVLKSSGLLDSEIPQLNGRVEQLESEPMASQGSSRCSSLSSCEHFLNAMLDLQSLKALVKASEREVEEINLKIKKTKEKITVTRTKYLSFREDLEYGESTLVRMGRLKESDKTFFEEKTPKLDIDKDLSGSLSSEETLVIGEVSSEDLFRDQLRSLQSQLGNLGRTKNSLDIELNDLELEVKRVHQILLDRTALF